LDHTPRRMATKQFVPRSDPNGARIAHKYRPINNL
jgi:hypothetical protein